MLRSEIKKWWDKTKETERDNERIWQTKLEKLEVEAELSELSEEEDWIRVECGKVILDGLLIANELFAWANKAKYQAFLLKIDFEKAYDNVNWSFLVSGFPSVWCEWIFGILSSARSSVLVNGSPTFEFQCFKGEWTKRNVENVNRLLRWFHLCSGLKINFNKSSLFGCNVNATEIDEMASVFGCKPGKLPFSHLGIPVEANMNKINNWNGIMDYFEKRLAIWRAHILSIAGRVVLIKAVLESLPVYYVIV
ncbi:uncharacterized protein LOC143630121 [Bidens hawaiensis]|uniref:uncharacterized protein LOC143630121 n=1 Tax=Bidens hawaiensis TaxID=980011 RepID=UPI004048EE8D